MMFIHCACLSVCAKSGAVLTTQYGGADTVMTLSWCVCGWVCVWVGVVSMIKDEP